mmetsp:Transcript_1758/g.6928  ORF Transcript_1758/g.6928 Transcript_1758/m.6928 type:complete len:217 (-) Transcript_1758:501-1151(-)
MRRRCCRPRGRCRSFAGRTCRSTRPPIPRRRSRRCCPTGPWRLWSGRIYRSTCPPCLRRCPDLDLASGQCMAMAIPAPPLCLPHPVHVPWALRQRRCRLGTLTATARPALTTTERPASTATTPPSSTPTEPSRASRSRRTWRRGPWISLTRLCRRRSRQPPPLRRTAPSDNSNDLLPMLPLLPGSPGSSLSLSLERVRSTRQVCIRRDMEQKPRMS